MFGQREFTTEEVARYFGVSRPAVVSWIAREMLPAHRTAGGHRRVLRSDLARFLVHQGYAVPPEVQRERPQVFAVEGEPLGAAGLSAVFGDGFDVRPWQPSLEMLLTLGAAAPDVLVVALPLRSLDGTQLLRAAARSPSLRDTLRVAVVTHDDEVPGARRMGAELAASRGSLGSLREAVVQRVCERQRRSVR